VANPEIAVNQGKVRMIEPEIFYREKNEFKDNDLVCHCFEYTRKQIENDWLDNGRSVILEKIAFEKKTGGCSCAQKNPKGR